MTGQGYLDSLSRSTCLPKRTALTVAAILDLVHCPLAPSTHSQVHGRAPELHPSDRHRHRPDGDQPRQGQEHVIGDDGAVRDDEEARNARVGGAQEERGQVQAGAAERTWLQEETGCAAGCREAARAFRTAADVHQEAGEFVGLGAEIQISPILILGGKFKFINEWTGKFKFITKLKFGREIQTSYSYNGYHFIPVQTRYLERQYKKLCGDPDFSAVTYLARQLNTETHWIRAVLNENFSPPHRVFLFSTWNFNLTITKFQYLQEQSLVLSTQIYLGHC